MEKNDTTGGGSFSENSESIGNNCLNSDKEDEVQTLNFGSIGKEDISWGKQISEKSKGKEVSGKLDVLPVQKFSGPCIRLTARKKVPNQFEKFTFSIPASSGSPSPIRAPDPLEIQARVQAQALQTRDPRAAQNNPTREGDPRVLPAHTRDPRAQKNPARDPCVSPLKCDPRLLTRPIREIDPVRVSNNAPGPYVQGLTRVSHPFGPIRPYSNWVWTRNPNLGFSSPSEV